MLYDAIADLDIAIDGYELEQREGETSSGFSRTTTVISLFGDGAVGRGEDVTYDAAAHETFSTKGRDLPVAGNATIDEFSDRLAAVDLFAGDDPDQPVYRNYRRWGFESAALDLALRQGDHTLATVLDRTYEPVRFVVSTRLQDPPTGERVDDWLDRTPDLEFKLDPTPEWSEALVDRLASTGAVRTLDLKGQYDGTSVDQAADPALYERVLDGFPDAIIEDPALNDETRPLVEGEHDRVAWDYPIRNVDAIEDLPWDPSWVNIKPSRFGSLRALCETIEYCQEREITLYGGGQFELAIGRGQLHALASLFYPQGPNDVAPRGYNEPTRREDLPASPLSPPGEPTGFGWD